MMMRRPSIAWRAAGLACFFAGCATPPPADPIPSLPEANLSLMESRAIEYRIRPGDTWYGIARRHDVDLERLLARNGRSLGRGATPLLRAGEVIEIPQEPPEFRNIRRAPDAGKERASP